MNNGSYENNNNVLIKGKIVKLPTYSHSVMGEGFFEMYVEVKRLSDETDILPVTISERLIDGFNPCAMWILLFLISVLIGMKNRKRCGRTLVTECISALCAATSFFDFACLLLFHAASVRIHTLLLLYLVACEDDYIPSARVHHATLLISQPLHGHGDAFGR